MGRNTGSTDWISLIWLFDRTENQRSSKNGFPSWVSLVFFTPFIPVRYIRGLKEGRVYDCNWVLVEECHRRGLSDRKRSKTISEGGKVSSGPHYDQGPTS